MDDTAALKTTPLHSLHTSLGARMVPFAGYDMPVQYPAGVLKEHLQTRTSAGLFDVHVAIPEPVFAPLEENAPLNEAVTSCRRIHETW